jgi:hypothetical protein
MTTNYTLIETVSATGCSNSKNITVTVNSIPTAAAGTSKTICSGSQASFGGTAVPGSSYVWTSSPSGFSSSLAAITVSPTVNTTYTITETSANGCTNSNSATITVNPLPDANAGSSKSICIGNSTKIGGASVNGSTYSWSSTPAGFTSSAANPFITPTATTTYTLSETNASGCTSSNSIVVTVNPLPNAHWGVSINKGQCSFTPQNTSGKSYLWHFGNGDSSTALGPVYTYKSDGLYKVTMLVMSSAGCIQEFDSILNLKNTAIINIFPSAVDLTLYPNPFDEKITINYGIIKTADVRIEILDNKLTCMVGINNGRLPAGDYTSVINIDQYNLAPGLYFIRLISDGQSSIRKIVKVGKCR